MITTQNIDILNADIQLIIHSCNCFCTMGAGIAKVLKDKFPQVYAADCKTVRGDKNKLGSFSWVYVDHGKIQHVVNLYGQYNYGRNGRYTNYEAIASGLEAIKHTIINSSYDIKSIGIPYKLGCCSGGGDWRVVEAIIWSVFEKAPFDVVICKKD